jgi:hypothetical protein
MQTALSASSSLTASNRLSAATADADVEDALADGDPAATAGADEAAPAGFETTVVLSWSWDESCSTVRAELRAIVVEEADATSAAEDAAAAANVDALSEVSS